MGAVCQPWEGEVEFRPLPLDEFAAFAEPGYAKIAWTLKLVPDGEEACLIRTRTRVATTDAEARRRYWAIFSPGILLIRLEMVRMLRSAAGRRIDDTLTTAVSSSPQVA